MIKILTLMLLLLFTACSNPQQNELVLSTNPWIGYTPLFYAQEKGYLKEINIKLLSAVSLGESSNIFSVSKAQLLTTTQHEYLALKNEVTSIVPIILIDRSDGGDMILSNKTIQELNESKSIDVYLEIDSINKEMIEDFTQRHQLDANKMHYINRDQAQIQEITPFTSKAILIATYTPNNIKLEKKGFKELASTKDINTILVIDAICTTQQILHTNKKRLQKLKAIIEKSIEEIMADKIAAHRITRKYLDNLSYEEFSNSLETIKWLNNPSQELLKKINLMGYKKENLL